MATRVRSFSKINLGLAIGPVRADGFHGLTTLYQTLAAHDLVTVSVEQLVASACNRIVLSSNDRRVPLDGRNTVWKMLERALALEPFAGRHWAVQAHLEKRLPMQGGLGAGSANAAAALVALERETGLALPGGERLRVAAEVGSDVPLFLIGGAVLGLGRGEQVYPMPDLVPCSGSGPDRKAGLDPHPEIGLPPGLTLQRAESCGQEPADEAPGVEVVLALPALGVSTPQAFREWDRRVQERSRETPHAKAGTLTAGQLTAGQSSDRMAELGRALAVSLSEPHHSSGVFSSFVRKDLARHPLAALVRAGIENDFEQVVFRQHPLLGTIKRALLGPDYQADDLDASGIDAGIVAGTDPWIVPGNVPGIDSGALAGTGTLHAALSGSGSALFGLYASAAAASAAEQRLRSISVASLRTRLLGRAAYWAQMLAPV